MPAFCDHWIEVPLRTKNKVECSVGSSANQQRLPGVEEVPRHPELPQTFLRLTQKSHAEAARLLLSSISQPDIHSLPSLKSLYSPPLNCESSSTVCPHNMSALAGSGQGPSLSSDSIAKQFGSHLPWAEPSWYSGRPSPYYNDSHKHLRNVVRKWVEEVGPHLPSTHHSTDTPRMSSTKPKNGKPPAPSPIVSTRNAPTMASSSPSPSANPSLKNGITTPSSAAFPPRNGTAFTTSSSGTSSTAAEPSPPSSWVSPSGRHRFGSMHLRRSRRRSCPRF
jgi:hypothetical protein